MQNGRALCLAPPLKWSILPLSEHILISGRTEVHICWQAQKTSENNDSSKGHQIETSCKCPFLDTPSPSLIYFCSTWSLRRYHYVWVHTTVIAKDSSNFANCLGHGWHSFHRPHWEACTTHIVRIRSLCQSWIDCGRFPRNCTAWSKPLSRRNKACGQITDRYSTVAAASWQGVNFWQ